MSIRYQLTGILLAFVAGTAMAQSVPSTQLDPADVRFIQEAGTAGENEIALGQLGSTNGKSGDTQSFGRQMVTDHTRANEKLTAIAVKKGTSIPTAPVADTRETERIGKLSGSAFDQAFAKKMVTDHQKAVALFEKEAKAGKDPDLRAFATETLPTLRHHLTMAEKLPGQ